MSLKMYFKTLSCIKPIPHLLEWEKINIHFKNNYFNQSYLHRNHTDSIEDEDVKMQNKLI